MAELTTLWKRSPGSATRFVTREELADLVESLRSEIRAFADRYFLLSVDHEKRPLRLEPAAAAAKTKTPAAAGARAKYPRARGHVHRGRCGKNCFAGKRGIRK